MANEWQFDMQHSGISFMVRHLLVAKVRGRFTRWSGTLRFDEKNLAASSVEVQIDTSSVDTSEAQRDAHLRSPDFLDVANHPRMTFQSTKVERVGDAFKVKGDLTIRDVTRPVVLDVEYGGSLRDPWGNQRAGFTARATIDRKDFGISFNQILDHGGLALGEHVTIEIDIEATRVAAQVSPDAAATSTVRLPHSP
jgi:polyisoprenoid-binding protein YceI